MAEFIRLQHQKDFKLERDKYHIYDQEEEYRKN